MYSPQQLSGDLATYIQAELQRLAEDLNTAQPTLKLSVSYAAPKKFSDGVIALADGTSWNPGSGAGYYGYRGGAWRKLD